MIPTEFCKTDFGIWEMVKSCKADYSKDKQNQKTVDYAPRIPREPETKERLSNLIQSQVVA